MRRFKIFFALLLVSLFVLPTVSTAFAQSIAKVIALQGKVELVRNGETMTLAIKDDIFVKDEIKTAEDGRVQLIFNDDTMVNIAASSIFAIEDYSLEGKKTFASSITTGLVRYVTGAIVKGNPDAFTVRTPEATVGIRGSDLFVISGISTDEMMGVMLGEMFQRIAAVQEGRPSPSQEDAVPFENITFVAVAHTGMTNGILVNDVPLNSAQGVVVGSQSGMSSIFSLGVHDIQNLQGMTSVPVNVSGTFGQPDSSMIFSSPSSQLGDINALQVGNNSQLDVSANSLLPAETGEASASGNFSFGDGVSGRQSSGTFNFKANLISGGILDVNFNTTEAGAGSFTVTGGYGVIASKNFLLGGGTVSYVPQGGAGGDSPSTSWNAEGDSTLNVGSSFSGTLEIRPKDWDIVQGTFEGSLQ